MEEGGVVGDVDVVVEGGVGRGVVDVVVPVYQVVPVLEEVVDPVVPEVLPVAQY